jgi:hypothetical protein
MALSCDIKDFKRPLHADSGMVKLICNAAKRSEAGGWE